MFFSKKNKDIKYSDLSSRDQKKIMGKTIRDANKDQLDLVKKFDKKFGNLTHVKT